MNDFPRTVEDIYNDYSNRRSGLLRALTEDVDDFYQQCDPEHDNMCLYGLRDGSWAVDLPAEEVPPELPEPCLGINFARDGMARKDWLALVAVHSDAWLLSVAFFYGVKLDAGGRSNLFKLCNQLPTIFEMVTGRSGRMKTGFGLFPNQSKRKKDSEFDEPMENPHPTTKVLRNEDVTVALRGRRAQLFWPDDNLWYPVEIQNINLRNKVAKIQYASGELEDLELDEIIRDGQMYVYPS